MLICVKKKIKISWYLCADKNKSVIKYKLPENETQIFASKCKLYLPSEYDEEKQNNLSGQG